MASETTAIFMASSINVVTKLNDCICPDGQGALRILFRFAAQTVTFTFNLEIGYGHKD